jgi:hypothetical protein
MLSFKQFLIEKLIPDDMDDPRWLPFNPIHNQVKPSISPTQTVAPQGRNEIDPSDPDVPDFNNLTLSQYLNILTWFNLNIFNLPDLPEETRRALDTLLSQAYWQLELAEQLTNSYPSNTPEEDQTAIDQYLQNLTELLYSIWSTSYFSIVQHGLEFVPDVMNPSY